MTQQPPDRCPRAIHTARTVSTPARTVSTTARAVRNTACAVTCILSLVFTTSTAFAQAVVTDLSPKLDTSITAGLGFLVSQQATDGSFQGSDKPIAVTGLALMAFLANGHTPDVGPYGTSVRRAVDYLLKVAPKDGYFGNVDGSRMYGHGIVMLALAEACGTESDPQRRARMLEVLEIGLAVICRAQDVNKDSRSAGGWRYEPGSNDSDLSLSGWNALALRACQNIGLDVPKDRVDRAVDYVLRSYNKDRGGFQYTPGEMLNQAMTGIAVLNLYVLSGVERPELERAAAYLRENPVTVDTPFSYYAWYYTTQAAFQASGATWDAVWKVTQEQLLGMQMSDGGWPQSRSAQEPGRVYATSLAVLSLSVPQKLLPTYQR